MSDWRLYVRSDRPNIEKGVTNLWYVGVGTKLYLFTENDERGAYVSSSNQNEQLIGMRVDTSDFNFFSFAGYIKSCGKREFGVYRWGSAIGEVVKNSEGQWLIVNTPNLRDGLKLMAEIKTGRIRPDDSYERPQIESPAKEFRAMLGDLKLVFGNWLASRRAYALVCACFTRARAAKAKKAKRFSDEGDGL